MALYRIKPLQWEQINPDWWETSSIFCTLHVVRDDGWTWRYCIDEFYDEGQHPCESLEEGKQQAEKFYLERLLPSLEEV